MGGCNVTPKLCVREINKVNLRTLDDHLMILLNGPEIENFDYLKVLEHWEGKKTRRII